MARNVDLDAIKLPIALTLYDREGGVLENATRRLGATWKRSTRAVGGYWIGQAGYDGTPDEMRDLFQNGMLCEVREQAGGMTTWAGFLAEMTLTHKGATYARSWSGVANRIKAEYSRVGLNLVTNPSCEAAVWAALNTPPVREQSTAWAPDGSYSAHVTADAGSDGVTIQTAMSCTALRAYQGHVSVKIVSGNWRLEIYNNTTGAAIDYTDASTVGETVMYVGFDELMFSAAVSVGLRLFCVDAPGEIYADAAVFQEAPARAETSWYDDPVSQAEYGIVENVLMLAGTTDAVAAATVGRALAERAYARTQPPRSISPQKDKDRDKLDLTFCGYAFTLRNKMTTLRNTEAACSTIIRSSVQAAQFVTDGGIQENTLAFRVDDRQGYTAWQVIADVVAAGDAAGNRYTAGVGAGRKFAYDRADAYSPVARLRGGQVLSSAGGALEGWLAEPGYVAVDDMPLAYDAPGGAGPRSPAWMDEVVWSLPDYLEDGSGISYRTGGGI